MLIFQSFAATPRELVLLARSKGVTTFHTLVIHSSPEELMPFELAESFKSKGMKFVTFRVPKEQLIGVIPNLDRYDPMVKFTAIDYAFME